MKSLEELDAPIVAQVALPLDPFLSFAAVLIKGNHYSKQKREGERSDNEVTMPRSRRETTETRPSNDKGRYDGRFMTVRLMQRDSATSRAQGQGT